MGSLNDFLAEFEKDEFKKPKTQSLDLEELDVESDEGKEPEELRIQQKDEEIKHKSMNPNIGKKPVPEDSKPTKLKLNIRKTQIIEEQIKPNVQLEKSEEPQKNEALVPKGTPRKPLIKKTDPKVISKTANTKASPKKFDSAPIALEPTIPIQVEPVIEQKQEEKTKEELLQEKIDFLFEESETDPKMKDDWVEMYMKAVRSKKKTMTVQKILNGRFRILLDGSMEILSDFKTKGLDAKDILNTKWL